MTDDDANLLKRLRGRHERTAGELTTVAELAEIFRDGHFAADAIARLTRERDEARAALASARNDALDEAATWHDYESLMNRAEAGQRGRTDSDYWHFDGLADRHQAYADAIRAMKREPVEGHGFQTTPVAGHEGPAVTHNSETPDTIPVSRKLLTEAHAVMRAHGWQLAPASATSEDGVIEAAAAEIEGRFAELIGAREP